VSALVSASIYNVTVSGGDLADFNGVMGLDLPGSQNILTGLTKNETIWIEP
jgi:hypothetical protein